jgi:hypothetical protein
MTPTSLVLRSNESSFLRRWHLGGRWRRHELAMTARLGQLRHPLRQIGSHEARRPHRQPVHAGLHAPIDMSGDGSSRKQSTGECPQRGGDNPSPHWPALRRRGGRGPGRLRLPAWRSLRLLPGRPSAGAWLSFHPAEPSARLGRLSVHHGSRHLAIWPGLARGCHFASLAQFHPRGYRENSLPWSPSPGTLA